MGEEVYYKRDDNNQWRGPGRVLGQKGPVVFVRHGSRYVKAHICCVQLASSFDISTDNTKVGDRNYPKLNSVVEENTGIAKEKQTAKDLEYSDDDSDEEQEVQDQMLEEMQPQNENQIVSSSELASENNIVEHLCGKKSYADLDRVKDLSVNQADQALETTSSGNELPNTSGDTQEIYLTKDISFDDAKFAELQSWNKMNFIKKFHLVIRNILLLNGFAL